MYASYATAPTYSEFDIHRTFVNLFIVIHSEINDDPHALKIETIVWLTQKHALHMSIVPNVDLFSPLGNEIRQLAATQFICRRNPKAVKIYKSNKIIDAIN